MSEKENNGYSKHCLVKHIGGVKIYLYKSWDVMHGIGFFAHAVNSRKFGFGFSKRYKLSAVKMALNDLNEQNNK